MVLKVSLGISQNATASKDSSKIPDYQLRAAIKDIERGDLCIEERNVLLQKVDSALKVIGLQDSVISLLKKNETAYKEIVKSYVAGERNLREQIQVYFDALEKAKRDLRRQKRKTFFVGLFGLIATSGVLALTL